MRVRQNINRRWSRCGHSYCSQCKTRRGRNRGNRDFRHQAKQALRVLRRA